MKTKLAISKDAFTYAFSFAIVHGINILLAFYIRRVLGPTQMGVWVVLQLFLSYSKFTNLGIGRVASRDIPFYRGRGEMGRAEIIRNTAFSFSLITAGTLACIVAAIAILLRDQVPPIIFYTSLTFALLSLMQRVLNFAVGMLRAEKKFRFTAKFNAVSAVFNAVVTVALIYNFKLYGYYIAMVLSLIFNFLYLFSHSDVRFKLALDWHETKRLAKDGLPFLLINFLTNSLYEIDRISVTLFLGVTTLGVYSIVNMANNLIYAFPNILNIVIWPYLTESYGAGADKTQMRKYLIYPSLFIAIYLPVLIGILWIAAPVLIRFFLPQYIDGVYAMKIGMYSVLFRLLMAQMGQGLITYEKHWVMLPVLGGIEALILGLNWLLIKGGGGLNQIALTTLVGTSLGFVGYYVICMRKALGRDSVILPDFIRVVLIAGYFFLGMHVMDLMLRGENALTLLTKIVWITGLSIPVILYGERKFRTLHLVSEIIRSRAKPKAS